jgi:hypothetical protein
MRFIKLISLIIPAQVLLVLVLFMAGAHLRYSCYSGVISSQTRAIDAAKKRLVASNVFAFPDGETATEFVANLDLTPNCCGAESRFSLAHFSTVWEVVLNSKEYSTFLLMDECGGKILDRGILGN